MDVNELKSKLRQLKKSECRIRFGDPVAKPDVRLIWDVFFSTRDADDKNVRYNLSRLAQMDKAGIKAVIDEYFFQVYFQVCRENGESIKNTYDPEMMKLLGLPPYAGLSDIKKRFRELAKLYHPDHGGESEKMIELLELYNKIIKS